MIAEELFSALTSSTLITTLVSNRVYPQMIPQKTVYPCIAYAKVSEEAVETLNGVDDLSNPSYQVDVYSTSYLQGQSLAKNIRIVMDATTRLDVVVQSRTDGFEDDFDTNKRIFSVSSEFSVWGRD